MAAHNAQSTADVQRDAEGMVKVRTQQRQPYSSEPPRYGRNQPQKSIKQLQFHSGPWFTTICEQLTKTTTVAASSRRLAHFFLGPQQDFEGSWPLPRTKQDLDLLLPSITSQRSCTTQHKQHFAALNALYKVVARSWHACSMSVWWPAKRRVCVMLKCLLRKKS